MANTILFKRGPKATLPLGLAGEPLYASDTKEMFVGNGASNLALVSTDGGQILTNKTIDADSNTVSNLADANFKLGAALDASKIADGTVSNTEFQYINGLTSDAQTQLGNNATAISNHTSSLTAHTAANIVNVPTGNLAAITVQAALNELQSDVDSRIPSGQKGNPNGVATLDGGGKVPSSQLPNTVMEYLGNFDALTNIPDLSLLTPNNGDVYRVSVAGAQAYIEASIPLAIGDFVIWNGSVWERSINSNEVVSVNGLKGIVSLDATAINTVSASFTGILDVTNTTVQSSLAKLSNSASPLVSEDIQPTAFVIANNQVVMADVTGFLFDITKVRAFEAFVSVTIDATAKKYESFKIHALNQDTGFVVSIDSVGDDSGVWFDVTNLGQVQYTSANYAGFVSGKMSFRAIVTKV
jgi:hypothetical protein